MANRCKTMETVTDFIFLGSKINADNDCSHKINKCLLLWRTAMTSLESVLKSRDITLLTKICIVKAMVFPVVMYGCKSWTINKSEGLWIDAFELWCWRALGSPLDFKEIKPVNPKGLTLDIHWKEWCWSWTPILWLPDVKIWFFGKDPMLSKTEGKKRRGQ